MRTTHEFRDFELSCEKHIMALASTKTGTYLSSSSGPSGPRTRMFRPLSGPSGPRVIVFFFLVTTLPRALASALIGGTELHYFEYFSNAMVLKEILNS